MIGGDFVLSVGKSIESCAASVGSFQRCFSVENIYTYTVSTIVNIEVLQSNTKSSYLLTTSPLHDEGATVPS
jgi:hypothetical protein